VDGVINPERWSFMTGSLKRHQHRPSWSLLREEIYPVHPFQVDKVLFTTMEKNGISQLHHMVRSCVWLENFFFECMNSMPHLSSIREPSEFEFLLIRWRVSFTITSKTWTHYCLLRWNFWGFGDLRWIVVRGGDHSDRSTWKKKFSGGHWAPEFFPQRY